MYEKELKAALEAAKLAQEKILEVYHTPFEVEIKSDDSPVTKADKMADALIREYLAPLFPEYGFLTEESKDTPERLSKKAIWIVDPVDGTKEFVSRNGEFTTNIALCVDHQIVVGVINVPLKKTAYFAVKGQGAFRQKEGEEKEAIRVSSRDDSLRTLRSISFFKPEEEAFYAKHKARFEGEARPLGAALKFCAIAEGSAEFFVRLSSGTKEWDVAPGDLLVHEAGGIMVEPDGKPFVYNREDVYNRKGYLIANKKENLLL